MITKSEIESLLGLSSGDVSDDIYNIAISEFFKLTGFYNTETTKVFKKLLSKSRTFITLPDRNIKEIVSIKSNGISSSFIENTDLFISNDSGLLQYTQGLSGKVEISYKVASYEHTDICDKLITLLCAKNIASFTPDKLQVLRRLEIGDYKKEFYSPYNYKYGYVDQINGDISYVLTQILHGDNRLVVDTIL
jgi:hypothetical protein